MVLIKTLLVTLIILLLDENFSPLSYQTRLIVSNDVYKIIKNENKSIILFIHDLSEQSLYIILIIF